MALALCFFPFLGIGSGDQRPYFLFGLVVLFIVNFNKIKKNILLFIIIIAAGLYSFRIQFPIEDEVRYLSYLIVPFLCISIFNSSFNNKLPVKFAKASLYIYFIYAVLQFFDFGFLDQLINYREALGRGMKSLTPEPSMFGFTIGLIMIILTRNSRVDKISYIIYVLSLLLCGSASAIIANFPLVLALTLSFGLGYLLLFSIVGFVGLSIIALPERLVSLLYSPSLESLILDASINERLGHLFAIFTNPYFYIFGGSRPWGDEYSAFLLTSNTFYYGSDSSNMLSGLGGLVYIYGIFGLLFLAVIWLIIKPSISSSKMRLALMSWFLIAIQSVSFANPLIILSLIKFNADD